MVSMASKMRTEECPLDLAALRSSVTFVGAVFVKQWGGQIFHEVRWGAQRASRVVLGTSGLRACGEGECVIALES